MFSEMMPDGKMFCTRAIRAVIYNELFGFTGLQNSAKQNSQ
jgi:hypothetical protein